MIIIIILAYEASIAIGMETILNKIDKLPRALGLETFIGKSKVIFRSKMRTPTFKINNKAPETGRHYTYHCVVVDHAIIAQKPPIR